MAWLELHFFATEPLRLCLFCTSVSTGVLATWLSDVPTNRQTCHCQVFGLVPLFSVPPRCPSVGALQFLGWSPSSLSCCLLVCALTATEGAPPPPRLPRTHLEKHPYFHVFTSISFLDVVAENSSLFFPSPDLQRPQRPWEEAAENPPVHPLAGVGWLAEWLTQLQTQEKHRDAKLKYNPCENSSVEPTEKGPTSKKKKTYFHSKETFRARHSKKPFASNSCARPVFHQGGLGSVGVWFGGGAGGAVLEKSGSGPGGGGPALFFSSPDPHFVFSNFRSLSWNCGGLFIESVFTTHIWSALDISDGNPAHSLQRERLKTPGPGPGRAKSWLQKDCIPRTYYLVRLYLPDSPSVNPESNAAPSDKMRHCAFVLLGPLASDRTGSVRPLRPLTNSGS